MAKVYSIERVKNLFGKVSLTNNYKLEIKVNSNIRDYINNNFPQNNEIKTGPDNIYNRGDASSFGGLDEKVSILCATTQVPGLSLEFETLNGARQGISEIFPSYRSYTAFDCTFIVDKEHDVLRFFNRWMNMINPIIQSSGPVSTSPFERNQSGVTQGTGINDRSNFYRMSYKDTYVCDINLTKFEKDSFGLDNKWRPSETNTARNANGLTYTFHRAFPVEIVPTPISYESPNILQVSVTFEYDRYSVS